MVLISLLIAGGILSGPVDELVLRSGAVLPIEEVVSVEDGLLIFVGRDSVVYSLPVRQVDVMATEARLHSRESRPATHPPAGRKAEGPGFPADDRLPHSDEEKARILKEIESYSHTGVSGRGATHDRTAPSDLEVTVEGGSDEQSWRSAALGYRREIAGLEDRLRILKRRERAINDQLLYLAGASGNAGGYGYLVIELSDLRTEIPLTRARLSRAEKEFAQFRRRARREGVPPGWLR